MEVYEELGFTKNESRVYETLVEHGKLGAGEISARSGVSYSKIYNLLDSLVNKGLVKLIPEKSKKFVPTDPEALINLIEEKEKRLLEAKEKAKKMKTFYESKEKNPVTMLVGRKGFYKIVKDSKSTEKYGYSIKWTSEYRDDWAGNIERRLKEGKDIRVLTRYDKETQGNLKKWTKINKNIRKFKNEGIALSVTDDEEVMIGLIKSNITLLIKNKEFAKIIKQLFLAAYDKAEKIN